MEKKAVSRMMLALLFVGMLTSAFSINPAKPVWTSTETIYIRADGSVEPDTAPIWTVDNVTYTFTNDIVGDVPAGEFAIILQRSNIVVDGAGYILQGTGVGIGTALDRTDNVTLKNVEVTNFDYGILLYLSSNNNLSDNSASNNNYGIYLAGSSNNILTDNNASNNKAGIMLHIYDHLDRDVGESSNNILTGNNASNNEWVGIHVRSSSDNTVTGNTASNNAEGIQLWYSNNNVLDGNSVSNNSEYGIWLWDSRDNTLTGNIASNNTLNFKVYDDFINYVDTSNTVDGKPIYYLIGVSDTVIDAQSNAGIVYLINCNNMTIEDLTLTKSYHGVFLYNTVDSKIENVTSSDNTVGISLRNSNNNKLTANTVSNNVRAVTLQDSDNNVLFHNKFLSNALRMGVWTSYGNTWDDGYPSGGNYWSDYTGVDEHSGPNQDQSGSDGIGDTPYIIDENNQDNYPRIPEHNLVVSMSAPTSISLGSSLLLNATVTNRGSSDETSMELSLSINGSVANSTSIPLLQPSNSYTLSYLWTPTIEGKYNVTAHVPPVPEEVNELDNKATNFVAVVAVYDARVINTRTAGWSPSACGNIIAFSTLEGEAGQDLNEDGDMYDWIIQYYDTSSGTTTNTGVVGTQPSFGGDIIAFVTYDAIIGHNVIRYYDISTNTVTNTSVVGLAPSADGNIIAFDSREEYVGEDLNGDGDLYDDIIRYYDISTGTTTNTGVVGDTTSISGDIIAFTEWPSIRYYRISTGAVVDTGADGRPARVSDNLIAFYGDGHTKYYNISDSTVTDIDVGWNPAIRRDIVAFTTFEGDIGWDLNVDGDFSDHVIRYYDISTNTVTNTGAVGVWPTVGDGFIAFETGESWISQDLTGDGDLDDRVIRYSGIFEHEVVVSVTAPTYLQPTSSISINATATNQGSNDETNVEFLLLINGSVANSTTIPLLQINSSYTLNYNWTPTIEGRYNVTAHVPPLPEEGIKANNQATKFVTVDETPPTTTHDYDGLLHTENFTITLTATDALSGVAETYYRINNSPAQTVSADGQPYVTTENSNNTLVYWSVDNAGNEEAHHVLTGIKLDKIQPPVASFTYLPIDPIKDETVTFDASASYDPDGSIASYEWDFGDGTTGSGISVIHVYADVGTYTVILTVTDNEDVTDMDTSTLTISMAPTTYTVGVKAGDWIKLDYTISGAPAGTTLPTWMKLEILSVEGTTASVKVTLHMSDGTEQSDTVNVDAVAGGEAFQGLLGFIIPANLTTGDSINMGGNGLTFNITIEGEITGTYGGASRTVVYASFSQYGTELTYYWDKQTGVMVEASTTSGGITGTAKATETNMWGTAPPPPFWMQWWFYAIVAVGVVAMAGAVYFLKKRKPPIPTAPPPPSEGTARAVGSNPTRLATL